MRLVLAIYLIVFSTMSVADLRISLPRNPEGLEVLLGAGLGYDQTAYKTESSGTEASAGIAILTERFYLDLHEISYKFSLSEDLDLKVYGSQDDIPNSGEIDPVFDIKSGDSFDLGIQAIKSLSNVYVSMGMDADVTGTHNGFSAQLASGIVKPLHKSKFVFEVGAKYQDVNRSNYYFGVSQSESTAQLPGYKADAEISGFMEASYSYSLTKNLGLHVNLNATSISNSLRESPRIKDNADLAEVEGSILLIWQFSVYSVEKVGGAVN